MPGLGLAPEEHGELGDGADEWALGNVIVSESIGAYDSVPAKNRTRALAWR